MDRQPHPQWMPLPSCPSSPDPSSPAHVPKGHVGVSDGCGRCTGAGGCRNGLAGRPDGTLRPSPPLPRSLGSLSSSSMGDEAHPPYLSRLKPNKGVPLSCPRPGPHGGLSTSALTGRPCAPRQAERGARLPGEGCTAHARPTPHLPHGLLQLLQADLLGLLEQRALVHLQHGHAVLAELHHHHVGLHLPDGLQRTSQLSPLPRGQH